MDKENNIVYAVPITEKKDGETPIYRNANHKDSLLDVPENIHCLGEYWNEILGKFNENKALEEQTYAEVDKKARSVGSWMTENEHKIVFLYAKNCPAWTITDVACWLYGQANVPLYDTLGQEAFAHIIDHTQGTCIFLTKNLADNIANKFANKLGKIREAVFFDGVDEETKVKLEGIGLKVHSFEDIQKFQNILDLPKLTLDQHISYSFTSGTTSLPKGVVCTHRMAISQVRACQFNDHFTIEPTDVHISYLPVAHTFERFMTWLVLANGANMHYAKLQVIEIMKDIGRIRPTVLPIVPRLMNRFYPILRGIYETEKSNEKIKAMFGGRLRLCVIGSAPVNSEVLSFFRQAVEVDLREGFGQTETMAASFITYKGDHNYGHVGGPNAATQFKFVDVPEMNYFTNAEPPRGEVCMRGNSVFSEYLKEPEITKETVDAEGWNHTGDIGQLMPNGCIKIIDRKKNIYKLSQGEYVAPEKIQNIYVRLKYVSECFLYGTSTENHNVAIIHPNLELLPKIAQELGVDETDVEKLCHNEKITAFILEELLKHGKNQKLFGFEQAKAIKLWPSSFMKLGILTSTMKLQRYKAREAFKEEIQKLYQA